jgi:carbon-monoxide dehydrogenase large subunit
MDGSEFPQSNTYVGRPVQRVEDLRLLRGRGEYVGDIQRENQLHAVVLRSQIAHGRIISVNVAAALEVPGVRRIFTAMDIGEFVPTIPMQVAHPGVVNFQQPVIASDRVRYVGEPIALVIADDAAIAEDALQYIDVEFDILPVVMDRQASGLGKTLLFEGTSSNRSSLYVARAGKANEAFEKAYYTRRECFSVHRHTALPLETRGLLAEWDEVNNRLIVSGGAKVPFTNRRITAQLFGLAENQVDIIEYDVGGGFGVRGEFYPEDYLIPFAARALRRPIKWIEDRREHFTATNHAREMDCNLEIACDKDGKICGLRGNIYVDVGAYVRPSGLNAVRIVAQFLSSAYRIPNIEVLAEGLSTNKTPAGVYRGPGRFESCFFMERMLDLAAKDLNIDRVTLRKQNLIAESEMPYRLAEMIPDDGWGGTICDSGNYQFTLQRCLDEIRWEELSKIDGQLIDGRYHGLGVGCFVEGGAAGPRENARIELRADGFAHVFVGSSGVGQGVETVLSQIAADALEIPIERIKIYKGSTVYLAAGFGSFSSRATVMGGSAILDAVANLQTQIRARAALLFRVVEDEVRLDGGIAYGPNGVAVDFVALAETPLVADGTFASNKRTYAYGAAAAHVAVDPRTGHVQVLDYVVVDDVGRAINPLTLHGQIIGATVQGLGGVFGEILSYSEDGQILIGSLADYLMPLSTDYPSIRAVTLEMYPSPNNPLGAKGAGEGGIIAPGGVIANALSSALRSMNVEPRSLPLTPPRVWAMIQEGRASGVS